MAGHHSDKTVLLLQEGRTSFNIPIMKAQKHLIQFSTEAREMFE